MRFIKGQKLRLAIMKIANYCIELEELAGFVDIAHVVKNINDKYRLIPVEEIGNLVHDVQNCYVFVKEQRTHEINRAGYWKFRALSSAQAEANLINDLQANGCM